MSISGLWTHRTRNRKTGDVPTLWVGTTREESFESCSGCSLLKKICYAQFGTAAMAHAGMMKSASKGRDYSFESALSNRSIKARMVRFGAIGDPAAVDKETLLSWVEGTKREGLSVIGYTHHWGKNEYLKGVFMASCDTPEEAVEAMERGWRVALYIKDNPPHRSIKLGGKAAIVCPAVIAPGEVTCNTCRLCDAFKKGPLILFPDHGPSARSLKMWKKRREKS